MARINIEECWWTDPRRSKLSRLVGDEDKADGIAIRMWRLAQEFWSKGRALVPEHIFNTLEQAPNLIQAGLADVRTDGVYVRGSSQYLDWAYENRENARKAGQKSAEARRKKSGSAQPKKPKSPKKLERTPNGSRTEVNDAEPSDSGSVSVSVSGSGSSSGVVGQNSAAARFESRFKEPEWFEFLREIDLEPELQFFVPSIKARFITVLRFRTWVESATKGKFQKIEDTLDRKRWLTAAVKRECGEGVSA